MKKGYVLIGLFAIWCGVCTIWYLFGVKGASHDPLLFSPQPVIIAIVEILLMILGGFLLGFGLAWIMREPLIHDLQDKVADGMDHLIHKERELAELQSNVEIGDKRLQHADERI